MGAVTLRFLGLAGATAFLWLAPSSISVEHKGGVATLSGVVREEETGKPIAEARVFISSLSGSMQVTNARGEYRMNGVPSWPAVPHPTSYDSTVTVVVQRLGYYRERRELIVIEQCGHVPYVEQPAPLFAGIEEFLATAGTR